jgi:carboxypeptidase Q
VSLEKWYQQYDGKWCSKNTINLAHAGCRAVMQNTVGHILLPVALLFPAVFAAQTSPAPAWTPAMVDQLRLLRRAALNDDFAYQRLAHLTDHIGPRASGSPQAAAAVDYVAREMRQRGLKVKLEPVKVPRWVRGEERCELVEYPGQVPGTTQKMVVTALGAYGIATPREGITADVVVVNSFIELAALPRERVAGRVVLFNGRFDRRMAESGLAFDAYNQAARYRTEGRAAAAKAGAAAMLVRSVGGAEYRLPHAGATDYLHSADIPAAAITAEDADLIARLSAQGTVRLHLLLTSQMLSEVESYNVIADLEGSEHPEQVVIVSGHLDSWDLGTGAIDDGAGVAIAMATAHLLQELHLKPRRTVRIIAWMSEEPGLIGARAYGKEHAGDLSNHFAGIETDSGAGHPMGILTSGDASLPGLLQPVAEVLQESRAGIVRASDESAPDLIPLYLRGMPAFSPLQDTRSYFDYHHTPADTLDKVDAQELRENVAVVSVLAYALATMSQNLPRKPLPLPDWLK